MGEKGGVSKTRENLEKLPCYGLDNTVLAAQRSTRDMIQVMFNFSSIPFSSFGLSNTRTCVMQSARALLHIGSDEKGLQTLNEFTDGQSGEIAKESSGLWDHTWFEVATLLPSLKIKEGHL